MGAESARSSACAPQDRSTSMIACKSLALGALKAGVTTDAESAQTPSDSLPQERSTSMIACKSVALGTLREGKEAEGDAMAGSGLDVVHESTSALSASHGGHGLPKTTSMIACTSYELGKIGTTDNELRNSPTLE